MNRSNGITANSHDLRAKENRPVGRLDNPARGGYTEYRKGHCRQTVSPNKLRDQEMTAYFVRVGRSFRVYGQYVEHERRAYTKPK